MAQFAAADQAKDEMDALETNEQRKVIFITTFEVFKSTQGLRKSKDTIGTGFFINNSGSILTAKHLFNSLPNSKTTASESLCLNLAIKDGSDFQNTGFGPGDNGKKDDLIEGFCAVGSIGSPKGKPFIVRLKKWAATRDLALAKIENGSKKTEYVTLGSPAEVPENDLIFALGFPRGDYLTASEGRLRSKDTLRGVDLWHTSLGVDPGQSGGPVYWDRKVVAVVVFGISASQQQKYVHPVIYADELFEEANVTVPWKMEEQDEKERQELVDDMTTRVANTAGSEAMKLISHIENTDEIQRLFRLRQYEIEKALLGMGSQVPESRVEKAISALRKGKLLPAKKLFQEFASGSDLVAAEANFQLGGIAEWGVNYGAALKFYARAIQIAPKDARYLEAASNIAYELDDTANALKWGKAAVDALSAERNTDGAANVAYAIAKCRLGEIYRKNNQEELAVQLCTDGLQILEKSGGQQLKIAEAANLLAVAYKRLGNLSEAEKQQKKAVDLIQDILGYEVDSLEPKVLFAKVNNNLASLYIETGKYAEALEHLQKALDIHKGLLGGRHPYIGIELGNIASALLALGKYDKVGSLLSAAKDIFFDAFGSENRYVGSVLEKTAVLHALRGRFDLGEKDARASINVRQNTLGENSLREAKARLILSEILVLQGRFKEAADELESAEAVIRAINANHPELLRLFAIKAGLALQQENYGEATQICAESRRVAVRSVISEHPFIGEIELRCAMALRGEKNYPAALDSVKRAIAVFEEKLGLSHPKLSLAFEELALIENMLGNESASINAQSRAGQIQRLDVNVVAAIDL